MEKQRETIQRSRTGIPTTKTLWGFTRALTFPNRFNMKTPYSKTRIHNQDPHSAMYNREKLRSKRMAPGCNGPDDAKQIRI